MPEGVGYGPQDTASIGKSLNIIGNHAYCYAGTLGASQTAAEMVNFTSGNYLFVGRLFFSGYFKPTTPQLGATGAIIIQFNGSTVAVLKNDGATEAAPTFSWIDLVIPAFTVVTVEAESDGTDTDFKASISITGRVYGKID
jgi:hypothetical protein